MKKIKQIYWFTAGRCTHCGGKLKEYSWKEATCIVCGKKQ